MPRKTRREKEQAVYRLKATLLRTNKKIQQVDEEFAYLDAKYLKKDLWKTVGYSLLMVILIGIAYWRLR